MPSRRTKTIMLVAGVAGLAAFAAMSGGGRPIGVVRPARGLVRESFREPGRTRLENTWTISAQVAGRIGRIQLEPGDRIEQGAVIAEYDVEPLDAAVREAEAALQELEAALAVLDDDTVEKTSISEAERTAESLGDSVRSAESRVAAARRRVEFAARELARMTELREAGSIAESALDNAEFESDTAALELARAEADLQAARGQLGANELSPKRIRQQLDREKLDRRALLARIGQVQARLDSIRHDRELARLVSPVAGVVLERYDRGERPVVPGERLALVGDPAELEAVVDVLTEDALRLTIGGDVELESAVDGIVLKGRVRRIEPQAFTKFSSLGVEQQRVNVIVEIDDPPPSLGVGFRLYARFFTGEKHDALAIPRFAMLQTPDRRFYVFVVEGGRIRRRMIEPGLRGDLEIEVLEGLTEKDLVVAAPDASMTEGESATPREE